MIINIFLCALKVLLKGWCYFSFNFKISKDINWHKKQTPCQINCLVKVLKTKDVWKICKNSYAKPPGAQTGQPAKLNLINLWIVFFCLGFLSRTFTIHRTAGEMGDCQALRNDEHLDISRAITAKVSNRTRTETFDSRALVANH